MHGPNVLLVDDDSDTVLSLARALKAGGLDAAIHAATGHVNAMELFRSERADVAVIDLCLDERQGVESGFALLRDLLSTRPESRVIVLTGHGAVEHGVRALRAGAANFLQKPADLNHLAALIRDGIAQSDLRRSYRQVLELHGNTVESLYVGTSPAASEIRSAILYASRTNQSVLILGETGTGKGVAANAIHSLGNRSREHFVRYQPSYGNSDIVNSELFGHTKGSFTGAVEDRRGLIAEAHRGTLFLDEIDELPADVQVGLLGVLQEKRFRAVGSNRESEADFRLIGAMNGNIETAIKEGKLREDFYHRIAHFSIHLPALRDRIEDLPYLAAAILERFRHREQLPVFAVAPEALELLSGYGWPGNIRQLEAVIEGGAYRAHYEGRGRIESKDVHLPPAPGKISAVKSPDSSFHERVEAYKLNLVQEALERNGGNQVRAAAELKLDRTSMRRLLARNRG